MSTFYRLLGITLLAVTTNNFVWFALTYWAYLMTQSVIATSTMAGIFLVVAAFSGIWFGSIVDHSKKKHALLGSSFATLVLFTLGLLLFYLAPAGTFTTIQSAWLWIIIVVLLMGTIAGSIYNITIPTLIGLVVPGENRGRANGLYGTVIGIAFGITAIASGIALASGGLGFVLGIAVAGTILVIILLALISITEPTIVHSDTAAPEEPKTMDIKGTIQIISSISGLFALILFTTFNNFLGGVFMALMDAYGLTLVSVQVWGTLWGVLSLSFILGGLYIARKGLGASPLRTLFRNNIITWTVCIFFTIQPSIVLLVIGTFIWMFFVPFTEAIENTIFQKVVPPERLGRVLGFAHSVEQTASPLTAFIIGPIAQLVFIPFMTTGTGVDLIGDWFGIGPGRGIALVFSLAGIIGLIATLIAMRSRHYALLDARYRAPSTGSNA